VPELYGEPHRLIEAGVQWSKAGASAPAFNFPIPRRVLSSLSVSLTSVPQVSSTPFPDSCRIPR
jgi:hypothetical protein